MTFKYAYALRDGRDSEGSRPLRSSTLRSFLYIIRCK
nr:MAG TPA: hypothetical protein [Caudoviricetes sp.]